MLLFDNRSTLRRILPAAVVCIGYWIFQLLFTWRFGADMRQPLVPYLVAQPLIIVRYFYTFLLPLRVSAVGGVNAVPHFWSPLALAGYAGFAAIVWLAVIAGRRTEWRGVSFGIWWFLIALAPSSLVAHQALEDNQRMYLAMAGLCFATAQSIWILVDRMSAAPSRRVSVLVTGGVLIAAVLVGCGWTTYARNKVWISETALWGDATEKSPQNPVGFIRYANALAAEGETDAAYQNLLTAASIVSDDPVGEIALARAFDLLNRNIETEQQFRRATASAWHYAPAFSAYAQWLFVQRRFAEAYAMANRALVLDPRNLAARHTLMDYYSAGNHWKEVKRLADETLGIEPADNAALHARDLSESVFDKLRTAEHKAEHATSPDDYLNLSVAYFQNQRFEDSIRACTRALALRPDLAEAYSNIAAANYALGRRDETEAALRQAIRLRPDLTVAKQNLEFILALKTQPQDTAIKPATPLPSRSR
jgi:tetratricopeptide (TPR) repeat protein